MSNNRNKEGGIDILLGDPSPQWHPRDILPQPKEMIMAPYAKKNDKKC